VSGLKEQARFVPLPDVVKATKPTHSLLSDSFCFNLPNVDSYYHSITQECCFPYFELASLYFTLYVVLVKCDKEMTSFSAYLSNTVVILLCFECQAEEDCFAS